MTPFVNLFQLTERGEELSFNFKSLARRLCVD